MIDKVDVSIIILNFNTYNLTFKCISSIIEKTKGVEYEIILIDNASSECTPELFIKEFPSIILIKSETNLGFAKGNNLGILKASGDYILLLNSDTELLNNAIFEAWNKIKSNNQIGALSARLISPDGSIQHPAGRFPRITLEIRDLFRINRFTSKKRIAQLYLAERFDHLSEVKCDWIWATFFLFPKSILKLFPNEKLHEDFFMYGEDMQWCWFMKDIGFEICYFPQAEILHAGSKSSNLSDEDRFINYSFPHTMEILKNNKGLIYRGIYIIILVLKLLSQRNYKIAIRILKLVKVKFYLN